LAEQAVHEDADIEPNLSPQRLIIGLEDDPLRAAIEAFLDEKREPADRDVLVFVRKLIGAAHCARAPHHAPDYRERAQAVDAEGIELTVFAIGQLDRQVGGAVQRRIDAGGRLPYSTRAVGTGHDAGDGATGHE